ncbi:MAG TPA: hypothetical protein VL947_10440, partial [Cytophagales bacterium]|nr:hypothetical protein [Cytophagales bacterium]
VIFDAHELIARQGETCSNILYILQKTKLSCDGHIVEIDAGAYLNMKEYFMKESFKTSISVLQMTPTLVFDHTMIERFKHSDNLFNIFLIKKLAQQTSLVKAQYE